MNNNVKVRISIRCPERDDYCCELELDKRVVQAIVEKAGGAPKKEWEYARIELVQAIEQTVINWANVALPHWVDRVRQEREIAEMRLDVARRLSKDGRL